MPPHHNVPGGCCRYHEARDKIDALQTMNQERRRKIDKLNERIDRRNHTIKKLEAQLGSTSMHTRSGSGGQFGSITSAHSLSASALSGASMTTMGTAMTSSSLTPQFGVPGGHGPQHSRASMGSSFSSTGVRAPNHTPQLSPSRDLFYEDTHLRMYPHHHPQPQQTPSRTPSATAPTQQYANPLSGGMGATGGAMAPSVSMHHPAAVGRSYAHNGPGMQGLSGQHGHGRVRSTVSGPSAKHQHYLSSSAVMPVNGLRAERRRKGRRHGGKKGGRLVLANKEAGGTGARPQVTGYISGGSNASSKSIQSAPLSNSAQSAQETQSSFLSSIGSTAYGWLVGGGGTTETPGQ